MFNWLMSMSMLLVAGSEVSQISSLLKLFSRNLTHPDVFHLMLKSKVRQKYNNYIYIYIYVCVCVCVYIK